MNELAITSEKLDLIKRTVAKNTTNDELDLFLYHCKRTGLDPLLNQIHCIKRGGKITIQTAIDGFRVVAERTGRYAGNDDPIFDNELKPRKATVTVYRMVEGQKCAFTSSARWGEYYPGDGVEGFMWRKMPCTMLGKCAEALALRKAFPNDLSGLYTKEEMDQADRDLPKPPPGFVEVKKYALKTDETLPQDKFIENKFPALQEDDRDSRPPLTSPGARVEGPATPESSLGSTAWWGTIKEVKEHRDPTGKKDWVLYRINMEENEEWTATTFDEALAKDAEIIKGQKVRVLVEPNKRKPGTFTYLGFQALAQPETGALWPEEKQEPNPF